MYDLIVIGGGPAGSSAAITAARAGAHVLLLEKGRFPRHKVCGEFVSAEALHLLGSLLDSTGPELLQKAPRIPRSRLLLDGRVVETVVNPPAASFARLDLDPALWNAAASAGVDARQQTSAQRLVGQGPFQVTTSAGEFEARAILNASGRWSNLRAAPPGNGTGREKWLGLKAHFAEATTNASVDLYFFPGGYCGVQPVQLAGVPESGRVNVCAMVRADLATGLAEVFAQHPQLYERSRSWQPLSESVSTSPLVFCEPQPEVHGILQAGDAAGFVDPFVGDGISLALRSGALAAQSLTPFFCGRASLADAAGRYRKTYRQALLPVFRASSKLRKLLVLPKALRVPLLLLLEKNPSVTRYMVSRTR
jgi:flavin-dependent dehydrogenase